MNRALFALAVILICLFCAGTAQAGDDRKHKRYREEHELYGMIDRMPRSGFTGIWIIGGHKVEVTAGTRIKQKHGRAEIGRYVEAEGFWRDDRLIADKIEVER
ncbi:MAG: DUF5666 domain-containing protein [Candidatus Electrothrix sp. YB6]